MGTNLSGLWERSGWEQGGTSNRAERVGGEPSVRVGAEKTDRRARSQLVGQLQQSISRLEREGRGDSPDRVTGGCPALDALLPEGGYRRGSLVEWRVLPGGIAGGGDSNGGYGADFLSLVVAREACRAGGALVIADPHGQFYPPAAAAMGISFANAILLRPDPADPNALYWAIDQALRCEAVGAVWGVLDRIDERWYRRFQLSAESAGTLGLWVRPACSARQPGWSEIQWELTARPGCESLRGGGGERRRLRVRLARCRGGGVGRAAELEINMVTGELTGEVVGQSVRAERKTIPLRVASPVAHSAAGRRAARA